ncbi:MAG: hypothetical protein GKS06_04925 [Acidobacteria bacterium]|nr:hypothetical protein [Acidobacteriota bacterium]
MKNTRWLFILTVAITFAASGAVSPATAATQQEGSMETSAGPEIRINVPTIEWGDDTGSATNFTWSTRIDNPHADPVVAKIRLDLLDAQGEVIQQEYVTSQVGPESAVLVHQPSALDNYWIDQVVEATAHPEAWWAGEPVKFRTVAAFVDGLQRLEVFYVLEDWSGRPVVMDGTVDMYIVERERVRAQFEGGGLARPITTLYARRFNVDGRDYSRRRIGFMSNDYAPPAVTFGPIHYSIFDREPIGDEGLVRLVFSTPSGRQIIGEDRVYF